MSTEIRKILIVEDSPTDLRLIEKKLNACYGSRFFLEQATSCEAAISSLNYQNFDIVLLDLNLPDSEDLASLQKIRKARPDLPVVVLTGSRHKSESIHLIREGAQDYLPKGEFDNELLRRTIEYAVERQRLTRSLEESRKENQRNASVAMRSFPESTTEATSDSFGEKLLSIADNATFSMLVEEYGKLLKSAFSSLRRNIQGDLIQDKKIFAELLGRFRAKPRDLVEVHVQALRDTAKNPEILKRDILASEAQLLLIEIMGYLALFYRNRMQLPSQDENSERQRVGKRQ